MLSAALAGISARLICHPLDTIKTVAFTGFAGDPQTARAAVCNKVGSSRVTFTAAARSIWQREGLRGLYRGVGIACCGSAPGVALYLTTYDMFHDGWRALGTVDVSDEGSPGLVRAAAASIAANTPEAVTSFLGGLAAEAVSCLVWVPIDVCKERLQSQPPGLAGRYKSSADALLTIARNEGVAGLYRGYGSTLCSFGPFSAIYFVCYEFLTRHLHAAVFTGASTQDTFFTALVAGAGGNIVASLCTNPLELVKTRLQVQRAILNTASHTPVSLYGHHYNGLLDGLCTVAREEGVRTLWKGVGCRIAYTAPNAALTMAFYQLLKARLN